MSDYQIAEIVGIKTYCDLYNQNRDLYLYRPECANFYNDCIEINQIDILVSENTDMCKIKKNLQKAVKTGIVEDNVKNLIGSSWSSNSVAMSYQYSIIWIIIVVLIVSFVIYFLVTSGTIHKILKKNFDSKIYNSKYISYQL